MLWYVNKFDDLFNETPDGILKSQNENRIILSKHIRNVTNIYM